MIFSKKYFVVSCPAFAVGKIVLFLCENKILAELFLKNGIPNLTDVITKKDGLKMLFKNNISIDKLSQHIAKNKIQITEYHIINK